MSQLTNYADATGTAAVWLGSRLQTLDILPPSAAVEAKDG